MKKIETPSPAKKPGLTKEIADFWSRNVNAERIMGKAVSQGERGSERYFEDLEAQRFRSHRHLESWITSMRRGAKVLEIGCGIGLDSARMARCGLQVIAADLTLVGPMTATRRARSNNWENQYLCTDAENLPFNDSTFDYVYSFGVMHHAADTNRCIEEARRVLKEGGQALIMLYHRHSLNELVHRVLRVPFEERDELCPVVRRFTKPEIREMFRNFKSVDIECDFAFGEGYGPLLRLTPGPIYRWISKRFGWHLMIRATR